MYANMISQLSDYGLSDKEAKIYLTTLELGNSPASSIARRSEIKRITAYVILEDMKRKWLINESTKDWIKYYSAISPDNMLRQLEIKYQWFKNLIPELLAISAKLSSQPKIQFFQWFQWMKNMYNDLLSSTDETIHSFLGLEKVEPKFLQYLYKEFLPQRIKLWIKAKVISYSSDKNKEYKSIDKKTLKETRFIKDPDFLLHYEINIYSNNKVAISIFGEEEISWIIIQNKKFHDTMKSIFNFIWKTKK